MVQSRLVLAGRAAVSLDYPPEEVVIESKGIGPTLWKSNMTLSCKHVCEENSLLAYLDLTGTKHFYENSELGEQIERISQVVCVVHGEIDNTFDGDKTNLFVHMYADSLVIAQKNLIDDCASKLVELMLKVQYQVLIDSQFNKVRAKDSVENKLVPTQSRALVRRGPYYGMICSEIEQSINNVFSNFSLIGGSAIIEMDKTLKGLPMGTYIDASLITEAGIEKERLIGITNEGGSKFVKPKERFDFCRRTFPMGGPADIKEWVEQLIKSSGNDEHFRSKITPWVDVVRGARQSISRRAE
ncbi:MAG: hypothetical protein E8D49_13360 [Nitrospira sp.]|nr:MAG: hypothetical protein E8D49_13360 [Nitrospira sp.]